jgi:hypothetical protein
MDSQNILVFSTPEEVVPIVGDHCFYKNISYGLYEILSYNHKTRKVKIKTGENIFLCSLSDVFFKGFRISRTFYPLVKEDIETSLIGGKYSFSVNEDGRTTIKRSGSRISDPVLVLSDNPKKGFPALSFQSKAKCLIENVWFIEESTKESKVCQTCKNRFHRDYKLTNDKCFDCLSLLLPKTTFKDFMANISLFNEMKGKSNQEKQQ